MGTARCVCWLTIALVTALSPGTGCVYVDPLFCGSGNCAHWLQTSSSVRGIALPPDGDNGVPLWDKDNRQRALGQHTDMGAYEDDLGCD